VTQHAGDVSFRAGNVQGVPPKDHFGLQINRIPSPQFSVARESHPSFAVYLDPGTARPQSCVRAMRRGVLEMVLRFAHRHRLADQTMQRHPMFRTQLPSDLYPRRSAGFRYHRSPGTSPAHTLWVFLGLLLAGLAVIEARPRPASDSWKCDRASSSAVTPKTQCRVRQVIRSMSRRRVTSPPAGSAKPEPLASAPIRAVPPPHSQTVVPSSLHNVRKSERE